MSYNYFMGHKKRSSSTIKNSDVHPDAIIKVLENVAEKSPYGDPEKARVSAFFFHLFNIKKVLPMDTLV